MKKFLSAFLAVLMVLSMVATSMVTVFAAEDAEEANFVLVSNGEDINPDQSKNGATQAGWRNHKAAISLQSGAAAMKIAAGAAVTDLRFHYLAKETVDTTPFTHVEFDLYVSDAEAVAGIQHFALELTSIGKEDDTNEFQFLWDDLSSLKTGWNHVKFAFSSFTTTGTFDATKWNFVRFFAAAGSAYAKDLVIAIDNFSFSNGEAAPTDGAHEIALPTNGTTVLGWEVMPEKWNMNFTLETPDKSNASLLRTWAKGDYTTNGVNMFWIIENGDGTCKSFDVSEADSFAIDMYFSDASLVSGKSFQIELGNGGFGAIDTNENTYNGTLDALVEGGLKNGWNTVVLPFSSTSVTKNGADWTKIDWFRLYNNDTIAVGDAGMQIAIDNVRFVKGEDVVAVMSDCQPATNGWSGGLVQVKDAVVLGKTSTEKFAICDIYWEQTFAVGFNLSNMKYVEYDLYVSDVEAIKNVTLYMELTSSGIYDQQESGRNVKIADMGLKNGWNHIKFELANLGATAGGATADLSNINFFRLYTIDEANLSEALTVAFDNVRFTDATDPACGKCHVVHAINLPKPGTTVAGWGWAANFELNDTVSVSNSYAANKEVHFCDIYAEFKPTTPVDASQADAFQFDLYLSDTTGVKDCTVEIEIASVQCDNQEKSVVKKINELVEGGVQAGWNTIVLPFSALGSVGGDIDWTNIKWFRIYNHPDNAGGLFTTGENGLTIALDNLVFTKEGKAVATLSAVNPDMMGWGKDTPLFAMGEGFVMGKTVTGKFDVCDVYYQYVADEAFDITDMKYLEFDFYLSSAKALKSVNWTIELTSAGESDKNEIGITKSFNDFVQGWNHVKIDLSTLTDTAGQGACDKTAVNFFRMFTTDVVDVTELTFALTNVRITDGEAAPLETPEAPELPEEPDDPVEPPVGGEDGEYKIVFPVDNAEGEFKYLDPDYKANWNGSLRFADNAQFFQYKFDLEYFCGVESITFAGNIGGEYHIWASANGKNWVEIVKNTQKGPAKAMTLDLSVMAAAIAETATLYIRIGDAVTSDGNGGHLTSPEACLTITYDPSVEQVKPEGPAITTQHEKDVFEMNSAEENAHLVEMTGKWNGEKRYADANAHFTYKYTIKNVHQVASVIWKAATNQELKLDISFDNKNWVNVFSTEENLAPMLREYDLTEFLVKDGTIENATFYLKISDTDPSDGWGGGIHKMNPVTLDVEYTPLTDEQKDALEATATEHSIPLWGANRTWGDVYETDNENQLAGSGCISINLKGVKDTHAPSKKFDDVNATGMDSLEFDIYLSDLAILDHLLAVASGSLEICSGGTCDQGEKNYDIKNLANLLKDNGAVVGWNHVSIPLSKMAGTDGAYGPFDISKINYIRLFWTGMTDCGQDWIMKLDNFRMTDAVAKADADRVAFENKVLEENAGLIANIEALKNITEVNAENYSSVKDRVNSAKTAFEALSQDAQDVLVAKGYKRPITDAQKKLDAYKAIKDVLDANADLIAELEALAAYADAASITKDNYDTVKAAVEAAQAKVDALDADTKEVLADYIANIATAKAAVDAYVPPVEKGCGGVLTVGAVATMVLAGAWVTIAARKKED